ncbi:hypothetical protein BBJ28_00021669 [Nothophytophthora sp. Chile5]|nr:hypothetical protein BBJ28_00021669 [Nothophytophthora sp. Chile5]
MMFVRDPDEFARKWKKFSTDRMDKLMVIADFDYTLTPFFKPTDDRAASSHGIIMSSDALDPAVRAFAHDAFKQYYPIEQSTTLTAKEKLPFMIEW